MRAACCPFLYILTFSSLRIPIYPWDPVVTKMGALDAAEGTKQNVAGMYVRALCDTLGSQGSCVSVALH